MKKTKLTDYTPDPENANLHSPRGMSMLEDSIESVGLGRSIVADRNGVILAGNGVQETAIDRGLTECLEVETDGSQLVVVRRNDLDIQNDPEHRARLLSIYDNRVQEVSLTWSPEVIKEYQEKGVPVSKAWTPEELERMEDSQYTRKVEVPLYEPSDKRPEMNELFDTSRTDELLSEIEASPDLTEDERTFLIHAAHRHTVFQFGKIADLYANGSEALQRLMENSALVIVDYDRAIELGYVKLSQRIASLIESSHAE